MEEAAKKEREEKAMREERGQGLRREKQYEGREGLWIEETPVAMASATLLSLARLVGFLFFSFALRVAKP